MFPHQDKHVTALNSRLDKLYHALESGDSGDDTIAWELMRDALGWLYTSEELARKHVADYYSVRGASASGRTLGGVIWVRGLVVHHAADVQRRIWKPGERLVWSGGGWKPATVTIRSHLSGEPPKRPEPILWPPRTTLPDGKPETNDRDVYYDDLVAGRELLGPLRTARGFLADL